MVGLEPVPMVEIGHRRIVREAPAVGVTGLRRQHEAEQRQVLLLIALEEMSYVEVSQTLGIPIGTVMSRLSRGRERLRRVLEGHIPASPNLRVVK